MTIHDTFYTNKFEGVVAFYKQDDSAGQVEFVQKSAHLRPQDKILDLACGFGRHSILLAKKGYDTIGYDQSADYIGRARESAREAGVNVIFERMDMRKLHAVEQFDVVLSLSTSLAFYDDEVNEDIFRRIHKALKLGGTFLFDQGNIFWFVSWIMRGRQNKTAKWPDGRTHHCKFSFDAEKCVISRRSVLEDGQEREESGWDLRYYALPELSLIMKEIGFNIVQTYGDYDCSQYCVNSKRLITIMQKF